MGIEIQRYSHPVYYLDKMEKKVKIKYIRKMLFMIIMSQKTSTFIFLLHYLLLQIEFVQYVSRLNYMIVYRETERELSITDNDVSS